MRASLWILGACLALFACGGEPPPPPPTTTTATTTQPPAATCDAVDRVRPRNLPALDRSDRSGQRIVGGVETRPGAWPWAVALGYHTGPGIFQYCGGALVTADWVLTAAHCQVDVGDIAILGRDDLESDAGEEIAVDRVLTHERYNPSTNDNDIALAHLSRRPTTALSVLTDAAETAAQPGDPVTVIGWGVTREGGQTSQRLRQVEVEVVAHAACARAYELTENMICAGLPAGGRDSCQGDSGGPLMARQADGTWAQVGIVSFGEGCARPNAPGVYSRISKYLGWIEACAQ